MMYNNYIRITFFLTILVLVTCTDDTLQKDSGDLTHINYSPRNYQFNIPETFPRLEQPLDNTTTYDGVNLGRHLFYDSLLSIDYTVSCASCHQSQGSFTDNAKVSTGVDGKMTSRSSMNLLNVAFYNRGLFWDGRETTLEALSLVPVIDPNEMANTWEEVVRRLKDDDNYPTLYRKAFGIDKTSQITKELSAKALAQFLRVMNSSGSSKYDRVEAGLDVYTDQELLGRDLFFDENPDVPDAECNHCHSIPLMTANDYFNNGIDEALTLTEFEDPGLGKVTGKISNNGQFRAPTLRNIFYTAPYMHDGRFQTLEQVIEHYNSGGKSSLNKDPLIRPLGLSEEYKKALLAFIRTMEEPDFLSREELQNPFK